MSYILDALRKSESERRQGKVPDLGQQVQIVHTPGPARRSWAGVWIGLALIVNAVVMAYVFWPGSGPASDGGETLPEHPVTQALTPPDPPSASAVPAVPETTANAGTSPVPPAVSPESPEGESPARPTIIVPSPHSSHGPAAEEPEASERVPHLVELPLSFQKSIPDLTFSSHVFASDPRARRVMINGHYLRPGDSFSGLVVKQITEDGVVLSKQGQRFRIGVLRDWVSPR